jgi:iron-sulfur cluster repair protein YtfE (RIC family)
MNAIAVRAALTTVEQDHQMVLDNVQALKESVCFLMDPEDRDLRRVLARLRESDDFFATLFLAHMDEEEATLFPLLEQDGAAGAELVARLRSEHDEIRRKREEFGTCLEVTAGLNNLPRQVLRDLMVYGWDLWEMLDHHAHLETRALQQCVAQALVSDEWFVALG